MSSHSSVRKAQIRVVRALQDACMGTDLAVCGPDGISGGSVIGDQVEAYVLAGYRGGGYQVEMWTHTGDDAYRITRFARLDDAIRCAIAAARSRQAAGQAPEVTRYAS